MAYIIFIIPIIILVAGFLLYKYPPKKVNWFIGYRTRKSMKDENIWKRANKYCGNVWIKISVVMLVITSVIYFLNYFKIVILTEKILILIIFCEIGILLLSIFVVENKIKNK